MVHAHAAEESDVLLRSQSRNRDRVREKQRARVPNMAAAESCTFAAT